ncbi:serine-type endopeptidase [Aureococcus anophagefferens]|uniref:ATP-dependent Clp protease proteolytic subunit n=1 Tax=Aureococcus anophagefferens TaxID=44056 RepID=A0ABR1FMS6_AURAN
MLGRLLAVAAALAPAASGLVAPAARPAPRSAMRMSAQFDESLFAKPAAEYKLGMGLSTPPTMGMGPMAPTMRAGAAPTMVAGGQAAETYDGVRIGPPPDLASLLLHNRIVYLGMPMVSAVTELIVAELLYLNYESPTKPVTLYINSPGTVNSQGRTRVIQRRFNVNSQGQSVGFETEAFAIADCMKYIKPPVQTICVGQAFGAAAMLLAQGEKGKRFCLPNASIMLHQPRSQARGQASDIAIRAREVMSNRKVSCELMARACGRSVDEVMADASRTKYLQPDEAVEYGLIDKVLHNVGKDAAAAVAKPSFMDAL